MEDTKITIGFRYINEFGSEYTQESRCETFPDQGYDDLDLIGEQLDSFLSQCGFMRKGYCMLMESLTEDEREALYDYLCEYREQKEKDVIPNEDYN